MDAVQGLGPDRARVALFDPLIVPSGCRFDHARAAGADIALVHANCRTGWLAKVSFLATRGLWSVRLWHDGHVRALAALLALGLALQAAGLCCSIAPLVRVPPPPASAAALAEATAAAAPRLRRAL